MRSGGFSFLFFFSIFVILNLHFQFFNIFANAEKIVKSLGNGVHGSVYALESIENDLYVGGSFSSAGGVGDTCGIALWDGSNWNSLSAGWKASWGTPNECTSIVYALISFNNELYVGGVFDSVADVNYTKTIARWNGTNWMSLGAGLVNAFSVNAFAKFADNLYVGGTFGTVVSVGPNIARWNGREWFSLGYGLLEANVITAITSIGNTLYVAGHRTSPPKLGFVKAWNGTWTEILLSEHVLALASFENVLYVGSSGSGPLAKWSGTNWISIGELQFGTIKELKVIENNLIVGGGFTYSINEKHFRNIAIWNGTTLSSLDLEFELNGNVEAIHTIGDDILIGGSFIFLNDSSTEAFSSYLFQISNDNSILYIIIGIVSFVVLLNAIVIFVVYRKIQRKREAFRNALTTFRSSSVILLTFVRRKIQRKDKTKEDEDSKFHDTIHGDSLKLLSKSESDITTPHSKSDLIALKDVNQKTRLILKQQLVDEQDKREIMFGELAREREFHLKLKKELEIAMENDFTTTTGSKTHESIEQDTIQSKLSENALEKTFNLKLKEELEIAFIAEADLKTRDSIEQEMLELNSTLENLKKENANLRILLDNRQN